MHDAAPSLPEIVSGHAQAGCLLIVSCRPRDGVSFGQKFEYVAHMDCVHGTP
jgi:hypothetical protein